MIKHIVGDFIRGLFAVYLQDQLLYSLNIHVVIYWPGKFIPFHLLGRNGYQRGTFSDIQSKI